MCAVSAGVTRVELPVLGDQPAERADAAANRQRILGAARGILEAHGFEALTMDAVAAAARVGKGTIFRRFGDRRGLTAALLDGYMREFQNAFLTGPPPLGPGAPPAERLEAFVLELVRLQTRHLDTAMAAEGAPLESGRRAADALFIHVAALLQEIDPGADIRVVAGMILGAVSPPVLYRMRTVLRVEPEEIERSALRLLRGISAEANTS